MLSLGLAQKAGLENARDSIKLAPGTKAAASDFQRPLLDVSV
jgi:hypothetical protein